MVGSIQESNKEQQETRDLTKLIQLLKTNELTKAANWLLHECKDVLKDRDIWAMTMMVSLPDEQIGVETGHIVYEGDRIVIDHKDPEYIEALKIYRREYQQLTKMQNLGGKSNFTYKGEKYKYLDTAPINNAFRKKMNGLRSYDRPVKVQWVYGNNSIPKTATTRRFKSTTTGTILSEIEFSSTRELMAPYSRYDKENLKNPWVKKIRYCSVEGRTIENDPRRINTHMTTHAIVAIISSMKVLLTIEPEKYKELHDYLVSFEAQALLAGFILAPEEDDNKSNDEV